MSRIGTTIRIDVSKYCDLNDHEYCVCVLTREDCYVCEGHAPPDTCPLELGDVLITADVVEAEKSSAGGE